MHQPFDTDEFGIVLAKPDAWDQQMLTHIIRLVEETAQICAIEQRLMDEAFVRQHYAEHVDKPFFPGLLDFMTSAPVLAILFKGDVQEVRDRAIMLRTVFSKICSGPRNLIHCSTVKDAAREVKLWFNEWEVIKPMVL